MVVMWSSELVHNIFFVTRACIGELGVALCLTFALGNILLLGYMTIAAMTWAYGTWKVVYTVRWRSGVVW